MSADDEHVIDIDAIEDLAMGEEARLFGHEGLDAVSAIMWIVRLSTRLKYDRDAYVCRPLGTTTAGYAILFVLSVSGPREPRDLAELIGVTRPSVSGALSTLERDGLIERRRTSPDRRIVEVVLTERGAATALELRRRQRERSLAWASVLDEDEQRQLSGLLARVMRAHPGPPSPELLAPFPG